MAITPPPPGLCCYPGDTYDDFDLTCIDPFGNFYPPFKCDANSGDNGGTGGSTSTTVNVTVNISNAIDLANQALQDIASSVSDGIQAGMDQATTVAQNTSNDIVKAVGDQTQGIIQGTNNLIGSIGDYLKNAVSAVLSNIGDIVKSIASNIGDAINKIGNAVVSLIPPIVNTIQSISQEIADINNNIIQPITTGILATIQTVGSLTAIIEKDLHDGLTGILQLPGDIANGLSSINAALDRSMQQLGLDVQGAAQVTIGGTKDDTLWTRLHDLGSSIGNKPGKSSLAATFQAIVKLQEPDLKTVSTQAVQVIESILYNLMEDWGKLQDDTVANIMKSFTDPTGLINPILAGAVHIIFIMLALVGEAEPLLQFTRGYCRSKLPLEKMSAGDTIEALRRGFIDESTASEELAFQGFDGTRIKVLKDLSVYLLGIEQEIELWFRGEVSDEDLADNLSQHGVAPTTVDSIKNLAYRKVAVDTAIESWRRGILDDTALTNILAQWRYGDDEVTLVLSTINRLEQQSEVQARLRRTQLWAELQFSPHKLGQVPDEVVAAGRREGVDASVVTDSWQAQFFIPSVETMIELYFRGVRTQQELYAVMNYWMVPEQLRDDLVQARKSLIPWRTIPTMLANGVISEAYAKQQLQSHGFDLTATNALLDYAKLARSKNKVLANGNPALTTLVAARQLWELSAFTDEQYEQALVAHGYTEDEAKLLLQAEQLKREAATRKTLAEDIVNLVLNGTISVDDSNNLMASHNFTGTEMARVRNEIVRLQRNNSKTPTESELSKMVNAHAIEFSDWQAAMAVNGYAKKWIDAFAILTWGSADGPPSAITAT